MIFLFTDYGLSDPYCGLLRAAIWSHAPGAEIVDLLHCAPDFNAKASAHLLASMSSGFPSGSVCIAVIDPGVGSARDAVVMRADGKWYVGPDNGLLSVVAGRSGIVELWRINWRPQNLSVSFHGRDLFAPVGAALERGTFPSDKVSEISGLQVALNCGDLFEVIFVDHYGNAMTGVRAEPVPHGTVFMMGSRLIGHARVFSEVKPGHLFWYENSLGLVEFALNGTSAAQLLGLRVGDQFKMRLPS